MRWILGSLVASGSVEGESFVVVLSTADGQQLQRFVLTDIARVDAVVDALYEMSTAFVAAPAEAVSAVVESAPADDFGSAPADDFGGAPGGAPAPVEAPADDFGGAPADDFGGAPVAPAEGVTRAAPVELWRIETEPGLDVMALADRLRVLRGDEGANTVLWKVHARGDYRDALNGRYDLSYAVSDPGGAPLPHGFRVGPIPGEVDSSRYSVNATMAVTKASILVVSTAVVGGAGFPASERDEMTRRALTSMRAVLRVARGEWSGTIKESGDEADTTTYLLRIDASLSSPVLGMVKQAEVIRDRLSAAGVSVESFDVEATAEELAEVQRYAGEGHVYTGLVALVTPPGMSSSGDRMAWSVVLIASKARTNLDAFERAAREGLRSAVKSASTVRRHGTAFVKVHASGYGDRSYRTAVGALDGIGKGFGGFLVAHRKADLPAGLFEPDRSRTQGVYSEDDLRLLRPETVPRVTSAESPAGDSPLAADDFGGAPAAPPADDFGGAPAVDDFGGAPAAMAAQESAPALPVAAAYSSGDAAPIEVNAVRFAPASAFARESGVRAVWTVPDGVEVTIDSDRTADVKAALSSVVQTVQATALAVRRLSVGIKDPTAQGAGVVPSAHASDCQLSLFGQACENTLTVSLSIEGVPISEWLQLDNIQKTEAMFAASCFMLYANAVRFALAAAGLHLSREEYRYADGLEDSVKLFADAAVSEGGIAEVPGEGFVDLAGRVDFSPVVVLPHTLLRAMGLEPQNVGTVTAVSLTDSRELAFATESAFVPELKKVPAAARALVIGAVYLVSFDNVSVPSGWRSDSDGENTGYWTLARLVAALPHEESSHCYAMDLVEVPGVALGGYGGPLSRAQMKDMAEYLIDLRDPAITDIVEADGVRFVISSNRVRLSLVATTPGFSVQMTETINGRLATVGMDEEKGWSFPDEYISVDKQGTKKVEHVAAVFADRYAKTITRYAEMQPSWRLVDGRITLSLDKGGEEGAQKLGDATDEAVADVARNSADKVPFGLRLDGMGIVASHGAAPPVAPGAAEVASIADVSTEDPEHTRLALLAARFGRELEQLRKEFE